MSASLSMLGQAHSSPRVSGAMAWKLSRKRTNCWRSRRLSLWRISSTASAYTRAFPASSRGASFGSSR